MEKDNQHRYLIIKNEESKIFFERFVLDIKNDLKNIGNFIKD
jgi:hypothetical protein